MTSKERQRAIDAFNADEFHSHNTCFYGWIKPRANGEFTLTIYAVNKTLSYGYRVTEVNRSWSDKPYYVCKNVWRSMWGGIQVEFDERVHRASQEYGWYNDKWGRKVRWSTSGTFWYAPWVRYMNLDALDETKYKYCGFKFYEGPMSLTEYCSLWNMHKGIELLSKAGLSRFVKEHLVSRLERDKPFATFVRTHLKDIVEGGRCGSGYRPQTVVRAFKNGWSLEKAYEMERARYSLNRAPKGIDRVKLLEYLDKNDIDVYDYYGYCEDVKRAKEDILAFGVTFPRDFHEARVKMQKRIQIAEARKDKERIAALKRLAKRVNELLAKMSARLACRVGEFTAVFPTTRTDFRNEGNRMRNCIGGYFERCADGDTVCFFVNRNGKRVADVESSPSTGKVLQCRAKHNKDTDADTKEYAQIVAKKVAAAIKRDKREAA